MNKTTFPFYALETPIITPKSDDQYIWSETCGIVNMSAFKSFGYINYVPQWSQNA